MTTPPPPPDDDMPSMINGATRGRTKRRSSATASAAARTWGVRALIAVALGVAIGAATGVMTVNRLEPGRGTGVDSLQVMLDSIARGTIPEPTAAERAAESRRVADSVAAAERAVETPAAVVNVPSLVGLEEGAARNALLDAGLEVGDVQFQASTRPAGTVLSTIPAAGEPIAPGGAVTLILSDGRSPADTGDLSRLPSSVPLP
jgi:hypothetical protein